MNRLADETSPYLRQHKENPVDWYAWGDEAFAAAKERDAPILLSVGYSACHWCHVTGPSAQEGGKIEFSLENTDIPVSDRAGECRIVSPFPPEYLL